VPFSRISAVIFGALSLLLPACSRELAGAGTTQLTRDSTTAQPSSPPAPVAITPGSTPTANSAAPVVSAAHSAAGVAVVELFTSEGCSSCPPADRVLANLTARAKAQALPLYTLSFHVDYWNYLGWRDRFSLASYSERQHGYSGISANGGTYTPQAVVNGAAECVGSDSSRIADLIDLALKRAARTQIDLEARRTAEGVEVDYRVSGATEGRMLNLALLEPRAESQVEHGENAGERLAHVNVVRNFASRALSAGTSGHWELPITGELKGKSVGLVAFTEDNTQRDVSGATALELP
jgi:hypothetical protein